MFMVSLPNFVDCRWGFLVGSRSPLWAPASVQTWVVESKEFAQCSVLEFRPTGNTKFL